MPMSFSGLAWQYALPEIVLAIGVIALLLVGVFRGEKSTWALSIASVVLLFIVAGVVVMTGGRPGLGFEGLFIADGMASFGKVLITLGAALTLLMSDRFNRREDIRQPEFPILVLFASLGMMLMVSANDLISLYVGLELQSLALYVLAAIRRDTVRSTEAGLKYFVLGALSSGMLLYGASMVYGFSGTTSFLRLAEVFAAEAAVPVGVIVGIVFVAAGLCFKVSAVPFHMWTPDVYEGAPTPVTALFAVAPKVAAMVLFTRLLMGPFGALVEQWQQIIVVVSVGSMMLGAFAALVQTNIKRLMAYSSIGHVGYAFVGLAAGTEQGVRAVLIYMAIYVFMNVGTFAVILSMRQNERAVERIDDLAGLSRTHPMMALALAIFMFSMAGIPPLAGFFGKLYVFQAAVDAGLVVLAVIGVLTSVVSCYYYLRIVKLMYFDEVGEPIDRSIGRETGGVLAVTGLFTLFFIVFQSPVVEPARQAAAMLVGG